MYKVKAYKKVCLFWPPCIGGASIELLRRTAIVSNCRVRVKLTS